MESSPCLSQSTSFFSILQNAKNLDLRDRRGLRHDMAFVLASFCSALLCKRDGNLSSIYRFMKNNFQSLRQSQGIECCRAVSRSQLPLILVRVNLDVFSNLLFEHYNITLDEHQKQWFAADGKDLRGSILKGDKRGTAIVTLVKHETGDTVAQSYYNGKKESEIPEVRDLLSENKVLGQKISMDALHLNPTTLNLIEQANGVYLVGLKDNQEEMLEDMSHHVKRYEPDYQKVTIEKEHGRVEKRHYKSFDLKDAYFDQRWENSNLSTLISVNRMRTDTKTMVTSQEIAFYMTNAKPSNQKEADELFLATRKHWTVEVTNHIRDVSLKEDALKTKNDMVTKTAASMRTLVLNLLHQDKPKNIVERLELFADDFQQLIVWLKKVRFL